MSFILIYSLLFLLFAGCASWNAIQKAIDIERPLFDMRAFESACKLAESLAEDDLAAWRSTDSIMAAKPLRLDSLDKVWFVDLRDDKRYVFYGRYSEEDDEYYPKYAFIFEKNGEIRRISSFADLRTRRIARAVFSGLAFFESLADSMQLDVEYNHYIRKNGDGSYSMWFFPAGYENYCAHGLDIHITVDSTGEEVIGSAVVGRFLRYFELGDRHRTIELDNSYDSIPSLGNIFFAIINRRNFDNIVIVNSKSVSRLIYMPEDDAWKWLHECRE